MTVLLCCSCCAFKVCNVLLDYCLFILFILSAYFFTHRLPLIEFNCLCSGDDDDAAWLWAIFMLSLLLLLLCATTTLSLSYPLWTPSLAITGSLCVWLSVCLTPTVIVRLHFSTGSLSLSLAVYLFILAANTFAFRFVPQLPKEREARSSRQLLYVYVHTFIWIIYYTHTYSSTAWMHLKRQMNNSLIKWIRYFEYSFKWI